MSHTTLIIKALTYVKNGNSYLFIDSLFKHVRIFDDYQSNTCSPSSSLSASDDKRAEII